MTRRSLIVLGVGQCINWGVLYYAFSVLVVPLQRELAVETWIVTGAFSLALLTSAGLAPAVGRWIDSGHGPLVMQLGGLGASALLLVWAMVPGVAALYLVWAGLGLCMAAALYEPAFAIVGRAYFDPASRLRALGTITILGGLASTVFLPATAGLVGALEWRRTTVVLAIVVGLSTVLTRKFAFAGTATSASFAQPPSPYADKQRDVPRFRFELVAAVFALTTLANSALVANLVPALAERGVAATTAALFGGLMGAMQLPGRALLMSGMFGGSPATLLAGTLALHAGGLTLVTFGASTPVVATGTTVFALGAGLTTLVRPHLVHSMCNVEGGGAVNGRIARRQQFARACGPIVIAWLASRVSYGAVFAALAALFTIAAVTTLAALEKSNRTTEELEVV